MLLLFTIGLEFSLTRIVRLGRLVLQGGSLQVVGTLLTAAVAASVWLDVPWNRALFYGSLVALSSTAIVLKSSTRTGASWTARPGESWCRSCCSRICASYL